MINLANETYRRDVAHECLYVFIGRAILRLRIQNTLLRWRIAPGCGWLINDFLRKPRIRRLGAETQQQTRTFSRPSRLLDPQVLSPCRRTSIPDVTPTSLLLRRSHALVIIGLTAVLVRQSRNVTPYTWHILVFSESRKIRSVVRAFEEKNASCQENKNVTCW